jgi:hypothetical protein
MPFQCACSTRMIEREGRAVPCFTDLEYNDYLRLCRERGPHRTIDDLAAEEASRREVEASIEGRMIEAAERIVAALEDRRSGPS